MTATAITVSGMLTAGPTILPAGVEVESVKSASIGVGVGSKNNVPRPLIGRPVSLTTEVTTTTLVPSAAEKVDLEDDRGLKLDEEDVVEGEMVESSLSTMYVSPVISKRICPVSQHPGVGRLVSQQ